MKFKVLIMAFVFPVSNAKSQTCDTIDAQYYITFTLFKYGQYVSYSSTVFPSYDKHVTALKTPILNKLLPDYCFYSSVFFSTYYEYMDVKTALALSKDSSKKTLLIHSPTFTKDNPEFIEFFYGLKTSNTSENVQLANEIVSIFSEITFGGHTNRLINLKEKNVISFELWHGDLSWRIYDFYFDKRNTLTQIKIQGGVKRQEMKDGYKRE